MNLEIAYMIDTNVLMDWASALAPSLQNGNPNFKPENAQRIKRFMEENENLIYIPDLVWSEFLGVFLHKNLDISSDFNNFKLRFRHTAGLVDQMELKIFQNPGIRIFSWSSENLTASPFIVGNDLVRDDDLLNQKTFDWLKELSQRKGGFCKLLDGMDSTIVGYLDGLAEQHPERRVMLYSGDFRIVKFFPRIQRWRYGFSQNTGAICSLWEYVFTDKRNKVSAEALRRADVRNLNLL